MKRHLYPVALGFAIATIATPLMISSAHAGGMIKIDDTKWVSVGAGLRTSFNAVDKAAPNGKDRSKDFRVDGMRLYVNGQIHENIKLEFNTDRSVDSAGNENIRVLDALVKFEFSDGFNIWMGRMLPPSDRSNLDGPYYLNTWNFPLAQAYPSIFAGRDDGAAVWGMSGGGKFKYQLGAFEGTEGAPNLQDNLLYAARFVFNFWDPEPGYYNSSTYYGAKDVLAIGLVYQTQGDAATKAAKTVDFTGWSIDGLMEKKLGNDGVVSLEGTYYDYEGNPVLTGNDGTGYFVLGAYLFPGKVGMGQFQPVARYQSLDISGGNQTTNWEVGTNYIIDGHNARLSLVYGNTEVDAGATNSSSNALQIGLQMQI